MHAPVDGMVVYATTRRGRSSSGEPMEEGQQVRERQDLIHLPTDDTMMAEIRIHEASLRKAKVEMPVRITVDAIPGAVFKGRVSRIAFLPDSQSAWMNPDLKVYSTQIKIDDNASSLRPGMGCRVEIIVAEYRDALYIPVQCVVRVESQTVVYLPGPQGTQIRPVRTGLDNNRVIHILEGLEEGEQVVLSPPLAPSTVESMDAEVVREPSPTDNNASDAPDAPAKRDATQGGRRGQPVGEAQ
ncbi:MAG: HlyD family efflux transporter periplasmic adaptor subunit [Lentisphaerae bacterium]|nr:HlyD family efflux transporter periplasmic adaptor subunit [Lentisphaerota bacterium]